MTKLGDSLQHAEEKIEEKIHHVAEEIHYVEETIVQAALQTDEIQLKVEITPRLKAGIAIILVSFLVGYPIAFLTGVIMGPIWIFYMYAASWVLFIAGLAVGGKPARSAVAHWHLKVRHTITGRRK